ncbi:iron-sulfur cluster repair di-iron protein [compost metagenome]
MAQYIGRTAGPIAVMEYEHDQAKASLAAFREGMGSLDVTVIALHEAKQLAAHVRRAYEILTEHFGKEENVLFPMAENLLTADDKAQLASAFADIA